MPALLAAAILADRRRRAGRAARGVARGADRIGRRSARNDRSARLHHRHHRRRPARPDAGHGRGAARLSMPHLRPARRRPARPRSRRASRARAYDDRDALARVRRRASTSPPTSSRISRPRRSRRSASKLQPGDCARWRSPRTARSEKEFIEAAARGSRRGARSTSLAELDAALARVGTPARPQDPPLRL